MGSDGDWQHPAKKFLAGTQGSLWGDSLHVTMEDLTSLLTDLLLVPIPLPPEV